MMEATKKNSSDRVTKYYLLLLLLIYLATGILLIKSYRYQMNPDGLSYISIAQKYLAGNFQDAVNGYWGPLFSWLLVPLLFLKVEPLLAIRILNVLIGLPTILAVWMLSRQFSLSIWIRRIILLPLIPIVLYFCTCSITPDLLLACLLLFYFRIVFKASYPATKKHGVFCGLWGGIAYLAKSFALPFFISHFFLMNLFHYFGHKSKEERITVLVNFFCGFVVFGAISGLWIAAISAKYHKLTFSASKNFNMYQISPLSGWPEQRWYDGGLYPPPNQTAISVWEDPSFILKHLNSPSWRPYDSMDSFKHYVKVVMGHVGEAVKSFRSFSFLSIFIFITYILALLQRPSRILTQREVLYPFISLFLFASGYILIRVIERLLWPACFLLLLMGGIILDKLFQHEFFTKARKIALSILFIVSFAFMPVRVLEQDRNSVQAFHFLSQVLKDPIHSGDRVASNGRWSLSLRVAFKLDAKYYGVVGEDVRELYKYKIHHLMVWGNPFENDLSLPGYKLSWYNPYVNLRVYSLEDSWLSVENHKRTN